MDLRTIYDRMSNKVFNLALHYVQNKEDAEEITQDVFLSVHQKINQFREEATIDTWIYRITVNKCLDLIKHKKRRKSWFHFFQDDKIVINASNFSHPGIELEHKEAAERLFIKINALPEQQKTALILSKIEQMSYSEVAEIMQTTTKAVESLVGRAKENLKK